MAETVLYLRGPFPFGPQFGVPDALIRDAKVLLSLDADVLTSVRDALEAFSGFLDRSAIEKVVAAYIEDPESARALARLVTNLDERVRRTDQTLDNLLSQIDEWLGEEANKEKHLLSREDFEQLKTRLPLVIRRYPGLDRQAKARTLSQATGLPLERIEIICDLRPVFDKGRDRVEGLIPYTTLKVVCKGVDGLPVAIEAVLSHQDVTQLAEASADAKKKLAKLRELLRTKDLTIPCVEMTMEGDEQ